MTDHQKVIILVEDDTSTRLILQRNISSWGHKVLPVSTAEEAIKVFHLIKPELAIIDISLPGIDGITLAEMILQKETTKIILMSAEKNHLTNPDLHRYRIICKPFKTEDLKELIRTTLFI